MESVATEQGTFPETKAVDTGLDCSLGDSVFVAVEDGDEEAPQKYGTLFCPTVLGLCETEPGITFMAQFTNMDHATVVAAVLNEHFERKRSEADRTL
jgi:hypothetical protein